MTHRLIRCFGPTMASAVLAASVVCTPAAAAGPHAPPGPASWFLWNASTHTATLTLIPGYNNARHGFNFNGYSTGTMVIQIPRGAHVQVTVRNNGRFPHSALITGYGNHTRDGAKGFPLAFPGATTPAPRRGMAPGQTQRFSFVAAHAGQYALVCAVDHHAQAGMWDTVQVTTNGQVGLLLPQKG